MRPPLFNPVWQCTTDLLQGGITEGEGQGDQIGPFGTQTSDIVTGGLVIVNL
jgi:hypothetical protein